MALKATIFKAELQVADMDRHYYQTHALTIARHPSETDERMMMRVLAFALHADAELNFTRGLSEIDEPDLWRKDLTGAIELWVEIGQPDERRLLKACGRANEVVVYCYSGHGASLWWNGIANKLERARNLRVVNVPLATSQALGRLARRNMQVQCTIQDGSIWFRSDESQVEVDLAVWKETARR